MDRVILYISFNLYIQYLSIPFIYYIYIYIFFLGFGQTIQEAKNVAAINVLSRMFGLSDSSKPIKIDKTINIFS